MDYNRNEGFDEENFSEHATFKGLMYVPGAMYTKGLDGGSLRGNTPLYDSRVSWG